MNRLTIERIIKLGLVNFWRNRWLSLASALVMTLTLIVISIFVILTLVIGRTSDIIKSKMDITVYFNDSATTDQISELQQVLASRPDVKEVAYTSKEEAEKIWEQTQTSQALKNIASELGENPFPRSIAIKATDPSKLDAIAGVINSATYQSIIHKVSYQDNKVLIGRLISITTFTKEIGWIFSAVFVIMSVLVVLNTIRLAIYSRKDEIEIMRLVGANDVFIKTPFIVEGIIYGLLACFLATILLWLGFLSLQPLITEHFDPGVALGVRVFYYSHFGWLFLMQFIIGVAVGIGAALFSIRKYLRI
ncbi:MAG: permease-like cell division protein FtsX [Patescibacteria group bacterium]|jgi:cell division transport system permease protein